MGKYVTCGILKGGVGLSDIVCDVTNGDLIFKDDVLGNCLMSNLSLTDPVDIVPTEKEAAINKLRVNSGSDGVILSDTYLIFLKDGKAEYRKYTEPHIVAHTVAYDLDIEYTF